MYINKSYVTKWYDYYVKIMQHLFCNLVARMIYNDVVSLLRKGNVTVLRNSYVSCM